MKTKLILTCFLAIIIFSGCKTKELIRYVEIPQIINRIDSVTIVRTDSTIIYTKSDTVYFEKWKTLFKEKIKIQKDTLSIPYEVRVEVPIEKIVIKYKRDLLWWIGLVCFGLVFGYFAFRVYKKVK